MVSLVLSRVCIKKPLLTYDMVCADLFAALPVFIGQTDIFSTLKKRSSLHTTTLALQF
jgi:hypothetical protein